MSINTLLFIDLLAIYTILTIYIHTYSHSRVLKHYLEVRAMEKEFNKLFK